MSWPDLPLADRLVQARCDELDGNAYEVLTPASDMLALEYPLAATLIWRSMILFTLKNKRASRYRHAARHLLSCAEADAIITQFAPHHDHVQFTASLRRAHGQKYAFWRYVE